MFNFLVSIPGQILIKIQKMIKVRGIVNYLVSKIGMLFFLLRFGEKEGEGWGRSDTTHICGPKSRFLKREPYTDLSWT